MREQLLIFYSPQPSSIEAQLVDDDGKAAATPWRGSLADLAPLAEGRRLKVVVPSESVVLHRAQVPVRSHAKALAAVPYILEDQLLEEVEALHFAVDGDGGELDVASVSHIQMQDWTRALRECELNPQALLPDVLALPLAEDSWTIWLEAERVLVRSAANQGWVCQPEHLLPLLQQALQQAASGPKIWCVYDLRSNPDEMLSARLQSIAENVEVQSIPAPQPRMLMATTLAQASPLNLLQGPYRFRPSLRKLVQPWRYSLYALAALLLIGLLQAVFGYIDLALQKARLEANITDAVHQHFPNIKNINFYQLETRIKQQQQTLQREGVKEGYFYMVGAVGKYLQAYPTLQLAQLDYSNNQLQLQLKGEAAQVNELAGRLRSQGHFKVNVSQAAGTMLLKVQR